MLKPVRQALRILIWQVGWTVLATAALALLVNRQWTWSVLTGAGIGLLTTSYLMLVMIRRVVNVTKPATLLTVLLTWLIKTTLVIGLLLIAFKSTALLPLAVILGLGGSLMVYWVSVVFFVHE